MSMKLTFDRKLTKSQGGQGAMITIPRLIANAWKEYERIEFTFDGECLVVKPIVVT